MPGSFSAWQITQSGMYPIKVPCMTTVAASAISEKASAVSAAWPVKPLELPKYYRISSYQAARLLNCCTPGTLPVATARFGSLTKTLAMCKFS